MGTLLDPQKCEMKILCHSKPPRLWVVAMATQGRGCHGNKGWAKCLGLVKGSE